MRSFRIFFVGFFCVSLASEPPKIDPFTFAPKKPSLGGRVTSICGVTEGDLPMTITWLRNNNKLVPNNQKIFILQPHEYTSTLSIFNIEPDDLGNYTCVATNPFGSESYTTFITIQVPPIFIQSPTDGDVLVGATANFHCSAKGYPPPQVVWSNSADSGSEVIPNDVRRRLWENGTLTINGVTTQDSGKYTCQVSNGVGQPLTAAVQLRVHEPPIILTEFQSLSSKRGETTKIKCRAEGEPTIVWEWSQGEKTLGGPHGDRFETLEERKAGFVTSELVIRETRTEDAGIYKCAAKNSFGEALGTVQLVVLEPPKPPTDVKVTETGSRFARLSWRAPYSQSSPVTHYNVRYWTNDGKGRRLQELPIPTGTNTVLNKLHPGVTYYATVVGENSVGSGNPSPAIEFRTTEEEPSGPPTDINIQPADSTSLKITWKPPPKDTWNGRLTSYQVGYRKHGTELAYRFEMVRMLESRSLDLSLSGLDPSNKYDIIVRSINGAGMGPWSPEVQALTSSGNPPKTPALKVVSSTSHTLQLEWDIPGNMSPEAVKQFLLVYGKAGKMDTKVHIPGSKRKLLLRGLESNLRYELRMASYNEHGQSPFSSVVSETTMELNHEAMTQEKEATPFYLRLYFIVPVAVSVTVVVSTLIVAWACVARTRALEAASHLLREPVYEYKQPILAPPQNGTMPMPAMREYNLPPGVSLEEAYDTPWDMTLGDGNYTRLGGDGRRSLGHIKNDQNRRSR